MLERYEVFYMQESDHCFYKMHRDFYKEQQATNVGAACQFESTVQYVRPKAVNVRSTNFQLSHKLQFAER